MHKYKQLTQQGFALPTLIIAGTILMIVGVSTLVASTSITKTLQDQQWNRLADEAAQAGVAFATSCLEDNKTNYWTNPLTPGSNCSGTGSGGYVAQESSSSPKWTSTFTVSAPSSGTTAEPPRATATGIVTLVASGRTYTSNKTVIVNVASALTANSEVGRKGLATSTSDDDLIQSSSSSAQHTCVLASDNQAYCAGRNNFGQLGNGNTTNQSTPVKFNLPAGLAAESVAVGGAYATQDHTTCVLASDENVYCAGNNQYGQLGNGNTTNQSTPVKFNLPSGHTGFKMSIVGSYSCVVSKPSRYLYCAGVNTYGQLGDGTTTNRSTPVMFGGSGFIYSPVVGTPSQSMTHQCVRVAPLGYSPTVYCAGVNNFGQLGVASGNPGVFVLPAGNVYNAVSVGNANFGSGTTCVLASNNQVYCAGLNSSGQLGDGTTTARSTAVQFNNASAASQAVTQSDTHTCTLLYTGNIKCSGANNYGQLGDGTTTNRLTPVTLILPSGTSAISTTTGSRGSTTCALLNNGQAYCAGYNGSGMLGDGTTTNRSTPVKFNLPAGIQAQYITASEYTTCVLATDNQVYCAGSNTYGQLGDGTTTNRSTPVKFQLP